MAKPPSNEQINALIMGVKQSQRPPAAQDKLAFLAQMKQHHKKAKSASAPQIWSRGQTARDHKWCISKAVEVVGPDHDTVQAAIDLVNHDREQTRSRVWGFLANSTNKDRWPSESLVTLHDGPGEASGPKEHLAGVEAWTEHLLATVPDMEAEQAYWLAWSRRRVWQKRSPWRKLLDRGEAMPDPAQPDVTCFCTIEAGQEVTEVDLGSLGTARLASGNMLMFPGNVRSCDVTIIDGRIMVRFNCSGGKPPEEIQNFA